MLHRRILVTYYFMKMFLVLFFIGFSAVTANCAIPNAPTEKLNNSNEWPAPVPVILNQENQSNDGASNNLEAKGRHIRSTKTSSVSTAGTFHTNPSGNVEYRGIESRLDYDSSRSPGKQYQESVTSYSSPNYPNTRSGGTYAGSRTSSPSGPCRGRGSCDSGSFSSASSGSPGGAYSSASSGGPGGAYSSASSGVPGGAYSSASSGGAAPSGTYSASSGGPAPSGTYGSTSSRVPSGAYSGSSSGGPVSSGTYGSASSGVPGGAYSSASSGGPASGGTYSSASSKGAKSKRTGSASSSYAKSQKG